jgi:hypothetical protein
MQIAHVLYILLNFCRFSIAFLVSFEVVVLSARVSNFTTFVLLRVFNRVLLNT